MSTQVKKSTILIVEDDATLRNVLREKLAQEGFATLEAENGGQGFELALRERPDLILLDLLLPVMNGMTMLRKLRLESDWGKHVPVIILTNLTGADEQRNREIAELEPTYYLVKADWKLEDVLAKIRERLR